MDQRYRIFLFPWKSLSLTHSLNFEQFCFFYFPTFGKKKKHLFFFFSSEKFVSHSLATKADDPKNRPEKVKKRYLEVFFIFSRKILKTVCFFFPGKVYTSLTHSFSKGGKKKKQHGKKKTPFLLTHSIFAKKWTKINFSREIKKYDTFASGSLFFLERPFFVKKNKGGFFFRPFFSPPSFYID